MDGRPVLRGLAELSIEYLIFKIDVQFSAEDGKTNDKNLP